MKKTFIALLALCGLMTVNSCEDDADKHPLHKNVVAEKKDVKTFEIVSIIARENLAETYSATFGSASIELRKTSDSTLTFFVPDVAAGEAVLKFDLATLKFNVAKTQEVNTNQLISTITDNFDSRVGLLSPSTPDEVAEVEALSAYKDEVLELFNTLSDDEKRQTVLFYEANKEVFKTFASTTFTDLDASGRLKEVSDCPKTDLRSYYGCTAQHLGNAAIGLKNASREFLKMLALAGMSAYLAPASFGLSAFATTLALGTAGYLLIAEVRPAAVHFKHSLVRFLSVNWIFSKALFETTIEVFHDKIGTNLNLKPAFHSITPEDAGVTEGSGFFVSAMSSLSEYWNRMAAVFGSLPLYRKTEEATTLSTGEIEISDISNENVEYVGHEGQSVSFRTLSGNEETFTYKITVSKEGFVEERILTAKVLASDPCADGSMTAPVIANVWLECNGAKLSIMISFTANGTGAMINGGIGSCEEAETCYPTRLYFYSPGSPGYSIAANGYRVELISGTVNEGVAEITFSSASCTSGKSAAESLEAHYPGYLWKVELMNACNQRSAQVTL